MSGASPTAKDLEIVWTGSSADIRMTGKEATDFRQAIEGDDDLPSKRRAQLSRYFTEFCESTEPGRRVNDQQFKNEGKFKDGKGGKATIWTFKAFQWRLYGAILTVAGRRCFVGVKIDPVKKQNRADQEMLKASAKIIGALAEYGSK
ncbi:hypothetical protein AB7783_13995 [Tardiphaga sp. 172_B4_N1_3]|uniref:hypothetical protein n=1 Tax=Tardiphaga sp. 172_B4_N1_3 TaxID=3240787 RepID=UPI003F88D8A9